MQQMKTFQSANPEDAVFHLTLFEELCREGEDDVLSLACAGECLVDAVVEILAIAAEGAPSEGNLAPALTPLAQSDLAFRECHPELYRKTQAERGFAALRELAGWLPRLQRCHDREAYACALNSAERFKTTLDTFVYALRANADRDTRREKRGRRRAPVTKSTM